MSAICAITASRKERAFKTLSEEHLPPVEVYYAEEGFSFWVCMCVLVDEDASVDQQRKVKHENVTLFSLLTCVSLSLYLSGLWVSLVK